MSIKLRFYRVILGLSLTVIIILAINFIASRPNEITLKEAYLLGLNKAKGWDPNAALIIMTSVDDKKEGSKGSNGKRRNWNLIFGVPETNKQLIITINDKDIINSKSNEDIIMKKSMIVSLEDIKVDSPEALKQTLEKHPIEPGKDWAEGHHFGLYKIEESGKTAETVTGFDNGKFTKIALDASKGELLN
ncbi:hypothetical protein GC102_22915 [Paenibacillus sp. LMG 31460]|uniref:Uncharacterized protein n=1 Tax=Paenibacillus germinis TaxID=2654979 RepID=A0ABX1Z5N3_9BACL|nr:hypothetical protein [Paenibacillus germinis]NOU88582.1 hypothetical protein [Paenibacillus germinis]